jgi:hypothetical protein
MGQVDPPHNRSFDCLLENGLHEAILLVEVCQLSAVHWPLKLARCWMRLALASIAIHPWPDRCVRH